tara:strand:+ start:790 stop:1017 length:228 start_codon:yes stop_codon:yes gene_type:complete
MRDLIEVRGYPGLVRDTETNAILTVDVKKVELARAKKLARQKQSQNQELMETRLSRMETDMKEIKDLLTLLTKNL